MKTGFRSLQQFIFQKKFFIGLVLILTSPFLVFAKPGFSNDIPLKSYDKQGASLSLWKKQEHEKIASHILPHNSNLTEPLANISLSFEVNEGQVNEGVKFLARIPGFTFYLALHGVVVSVTTPLQAAREARPIKKVSAFPKDVKPSGKENGFRITFIDANENPEIIGEDEIQAKTNYLIGNNPENWKTGIPTYSRVRYKDLYPGIDLVFYGNRGKLEYDFIVKPGADPHKIEMAFEGQQELSIDNEGNIVIQTVGAKIHQNAPIIYQNTNGTKEKVEGSYVVNLDYTPSSEKIPSSSKVVGLSIPKYDRNRTLVIDPVIEFSTYFGGGTPRTPNDLGRGIAVDNQGNIYITGITHSADFPTKNPLRPAIGGLREDAFVSKFTPDGSALVFSTFLGGSLRSVGGGIAVDANGNSYIIGVTESPDFPILNAFQGELKGHGDYFITKLNADGSAIMYSSFLGSDNFEGVLGNRGAIVVNHQGEAVVTGASSLGFPLVNAIQATPGGGVDAFVSKISQDGSSLIYSTFLGGSLNDVGSSIAVDLTGNVYLTGTTSSPDFPIQAATQTSPGGGEDVFVAKLNPSGTNLILSTFLGGSESDSGEAIAVDNDGTIFVTGTTTSQNFPTANPFQANLNGAQDSFVTKLAGDPPAIVASTYFGGAGEDYGQGIGVDQSGYIYITGGTNSSDLLTVDPIQPVLGGSNDAFVTKFNESISTPIYSTYLGGSNSEFAHDIAVDNIGNAHIVGDIVNLGNPPDFPTVNPFQSLPKGAIEIFVTKISEGDSFNLAISPMGGGDGVVTSTPDGINCPTIRCSQSFPSGTVVALNPIPGGGSIFGGFTGDPDCDDGIVTLNASKTCIATFELEVVPNPVLSVVLAGNGSGTITSNPAGITCETGTLFDCEEAYPVGQVVTLTATQNLGSTFVGFTGDPDCEDGVVTMDTEKTCTVTFNTNPELTVALAGLGSGSVTGLNAGISCPGDCSEPVPPGTLATLTASPDSGSTLIGWTGCTPNPTNPLECSVTVNQDETVTAEFGVVSSLPDQVSFAVSSLNVAENIGQLPVLVTRTGVPGGAITIDVTSVDDSAIQGEDYTAVSETLVWGPNDFEPQTILVPIVNDGLQEGEETFKLNLSNPTGGVVIGTIPTVAVTIVDSDSTPVFTPLTGEWHFQVYGDTRGPNSPGWGQGMVELDQFGTVINGMVTLSDGSVGTLTAGSFAMSANRIVTGWVTDSNADTLVLDGMLDTHHTLIAGGLTGSNNSRNLGLFMKKGATFEQSDLAGAYHMQSLGDAFNVQAPVGVNGHLASDDVGNVTGQAFNTEGLMPTFDGHLTLEPDGIVTGSLTNTNGPTFDSWGAMDTQKTIVGRVLVSPQTGRRVLNVLIKKGSNFTTSNLEGTWRLYLLRDLREFNNPLWAKITLSLDSGGAVVDGQLQTSEGLILGVTGGSFTFNADQELVGSWTYETGVTIESKGGLDVNKTFATTVGTGLIGGNNTRNIALWVKQSQPASLDIDGNGVADALTDGMLILRYMFGFKGQGLINGVLALDSTRTTPEEIIAYLDSIRDILLDVDGNGKVDAFTDGMLIARFLMGFTGDSLINGVLDPSGTRTSAPAIQGLLSDFLPDTTPPSITITSPLSGSLVNSNVISVTGFVDELGTTVQVNGITAEVLNKFFTANIAVNEGLNTVTVNVTDAAGNSASASVNITVDTIPPVVEITTPANGAVFDQEIITVVGTIDDPAASVVVNGFPVTVVGNSFTLDNFHLVEGSNIVTAVATDNSGNIGTAEIEIVFSPIPQKLDSDWDGLLDSEELVLNTDPFNADTDHDKTPDGFEVIEGCSPLFQNLATVVGKTLKKDGTPFPGATVSVFRQSTQADEEGHFTISNVPTCLNRHVQVVATGQENNGPLLQGRSRRERHFGDDPIDVGNIVLQIVTPVAHTLSSFPVNTVPVGNAPHGLVLTDLNLDGYVDVLTANQGTSDLTTLLGMGDGDFLPKQRWALPCCPTALQVGDVNLDGVIDTVVTSSDPNNAAGLDTVNWVKGLGTGEFLSATHYLVGDGPSALILKDINKDGQLDILTANTDSNDLSLLLGEPDEKFAPEQRLPVGIEPRALDLGDINGDTFLDIVVANQGSHDISILLSDGVGGFAHETRVASGGQNPSSILLAKIDGDQNLDVLITNKGSNDISVLLGNGAGMFFVSATLPVGQSPSAVIAGQIDADNHVDVVVANRDSNDLSLLLNNETGGFLPEVRLPVGGSPTALSFGDLNQDGLLEILSANANNTGPFASDDISILWGMGNGNFSIHQRHFLGKNPTSMASGDFNKDGIVDLITVNSPTDDVSLALGNGDGTFATQAPIAVGEEPADVFVADLNNDTNLDFVTANFRSEDVSVRLGNGNGTFLPEQKFSVGVGSLPRSIHLADLDENGTLDIVTANASVNRPTTDFDDVSVLLGDGNGGFGPPTRYASGERSFWITVGHLNDDLFPDIVTANGRNSLSIFFGLGNGLFEDETRIEVQGFPEAVEITDLDQNGFNDLIVANGGSSDIKTLLNQGNGTFEVQSRVPAGNSPKALALGDINADGFIDIVTANENSDRGGGDVSLLFGNQNGSFDWEFRFAAGKGASAVVLQDFNNDGLLDIATSNRGGEDLSILLQQPIPMDGGGVPPQVRLLAPASNVSIQEGEVLPIRVDASDDVGINVVNFLIDGNVVFSDSRMPFEFDYQVPFGSTNFSVSAEARDLAGNAATTGSVDVEVVVMDPTTVIGTVVDSNLNPVEGAEVMISIVSTGIEGPSDLTDINGNFSIPNVSSVAGNVFVRASLRQNAQTLQGNSLSVGPIPNGITDVGQIVLNGEPDSDGDGMPDSFENLHGLNPNDPNDANQDKDFDNFTNLEEFLLGSDPTIFNFLGFFLEETDFTFTSLVNGEIHADMIGISNFGDIGLNWTATTNQPWLTLGQLGGQVPANSIFDLPFSVDPAGLVPGVHDATITVTAPAVSFPPESIQVHVSVVVLENSARGNFFAGNIVAADDGFQAILNNDPTNQEAHFFRAITRLLRIIEENQDGSNAATFTDSFKEMLDRFGFDPMGRSLLNFTSRPPVNQSGDYLLSNDSPTGADVQEFWETVVAPELNAAIQQNLSTLNQNFGLTITTAELAALEITNEGPVEVDFGEVKLLEAALRTLRAGSLIGVAYEADVDLDELNNSEDVPQVQAQILDPDPNLFKLKPGGAAKVMEAKGELNAGIQSYLDASAFIRAEIDDQNDDLIMIAPEDRNEEEILRTRLAETQASLNGQAFIENELVNLRVFFETPFDLRGFLPMFGFDVNRRPTNFIEAGTFPDATFNGMLPNMTPQRLEELLNVQP